MRLASRTTRLIAQIIDGVIAFAPMSVAWTVSSINYTVGVPLVVVALLFAFAYYFFADGLPGGGSYAKQWLNLAVVDATSGLPGTYRQSFIRNLLLAVLAPIDWIFIFGDKRQRLGDMAAGTIVRATA